MTRDQLEAAVWRALAADPERAADREMVDAVLAAADAYATAEVGLLTPAERRRVLRDAT